MKLRTVNKVTNVSLTRIGHPYLIRPDDSLPVASSLNLMIVNKIML